MDYEVVIYRKVMAGIAIGFACFWHLAVVVRESIQYELEEFLVCFIFISMLSEVWHV